jgi:hypothetical protein
VPQRLPLSRGFRCHRHVLAMSPDPRLAPDAEPQALPRLQSFPL